MEISCGTDIIEIYRIKESIEEIGERFLERVYTKKEIEYCESKRKQKYQHYAARFSAKEAVFKAISKEIKNKYEIQWKNIEVVNDCNGRPTINLLDIKIEGIDSIDISISHCKEYAVADVVVIWKK